MVTSRTYFAYLTSRRQYFFLWLNYRLIFVSVVPFNQRCLYFSSAITCLPNFAKAFPPLVRECISVLQQLGRVTHAYISTHYPHLTTDYATTFEDWSFENESAFFDNLTKELGSDSLDSHVDLHNRVRKTFYTMIEQTLT